VSGILRISRSYFDIAAHVPRHEELVVGLDLLANRPYPLQRKFPGLICEAHGFTIVFQANVEQDLAVALYQALLDVLSECGDIFFGRVGKERL
jgi:hypothetical protein